MTRTDKPTIPEVVGRFAEYFSLPENGAWGSLHNVLDDGNVSDSNVEYCLENAIERGDHEGTELAELLLQMSRTQRIKLPFAVRDHLRALSETPRENALRF